MLRRTTSSQQAFMGGYGRGGLCPAVLTETGKNSISFPGPDAERGQSWEREVHIEKAAGRSLLSALSRMLAVWASRSDQMLRLCICRKALTASVGAFILQAPMISHCLLLFDYKLLLFTMRKTPLYIRQISFWLKHACMSQKAFRK